MHKQYILQLGSPLSDLSTTGGKGASLAKLMRAGLPVPGGFHVTTTAYDQFVSENCLQKGINAALKPVDIAKPESLEAASKIIKDLFHQASIPDSIAAAVVSAYLDLPGSDVPVAVRSSATAEDLPEASFAGQQDTMLNVVGAESVLGAVRNCWASLWTARAIGYRSRQSISAEGVSLAVVVQILIPAEVAGIMFTANPLNGVRDEMVINAAWGLGEAVVGGTVTPDTLIVEKETCSVIERDIARKLVQTVRTKSGTEEQAVPVGLQDIPALEDVQASELAELGVRIEKLYNMPMDIEWVLKDGVFSIVQARPITALPEPPIEWVPPDPKGVYMRGSVVDLLPDPISPLFETLGITALKTQMKPLGKRITRSEPVLADDYFTSINNYAYMNATMPPKALWWILTGLIPAYPKFLTKLVPLWRDELHPEYQAYVESLQNSVPAEMSAGELWHIAQEILDAAMYYVCALMFATMGASAGSEMMLTKVYDKFARQESDPPASVLLMGWDNIPIQSEKSLYDLAEWCREDSDLSEVILQRPSRELAELLGNGSTPPGIDSSAWGTFQKRFMAHMDKFGHIIFQLDFAEELPLDHPEPMLETIKMYLRGGGINPYERQRASEETRIQTVEMMGNRLKGFKRWLFRKALRWGQSLAEVREDALADIGLGYPKLREMLLSLGHRFTDAGVIQRAEDIFWLEKDEIDRGTRNLETNIELVDLTQNLNIRKAFRERVKSTTPPPMIPVKERIMGVKSDLFISYSQDGDSEGTLSGVPASAGVVTAPACVLHGPEDFGLMRPGDVLVAGTTTPAWTPLFVMASAVVTDIGGPLSHGSIVAREYGIPAVMGTGEATRRIKNGQTITVDGGNGTVEILEKTGESNA